MSDNGARGLRRWLPGHEAGRSGRAGVPRGGRRAVWRRVQARRVAAAALAGGAVWAAISAFAPQEPPGERAVVAATDLAAGHRLGADDLSVVPIDAQAAPASRLGEVSGAVGQVLAAPMERGEMVTASRLRPSSALTELPGGARALHVPVADPGTVALVRPGDRVDVVSAGNGEVVGGGMLVLSIDPVAGQESPLGPGERGGAGLVLAVPPGDVGRIVAASIGNSTDGVQLALRSDATAR